MNNITTTIARCEDIKGIVAVRHDTWLTTYPNQELGITIDDIKEKLKDMHKGEEERWIKRITNDSSCRAWVAKERNKIVGFISVQKLQDKNKIWSLYLLSEFQGKGIGRLLMDQGLNWLGSEKKVILEVASYNTKAINFYKSYGFVESGQTTTPIGSLPNGKIIPETVMIKE